ncbi:hypothetical protein M5362_02845 [Streptomyces sp. Je 1-79]|uniref:hypothetical protein n=1 Tax=Streptomyces sp. Je 1-79 TaxID=2943847 RepID=UPI0021A412C8|nr:hypothetical protein [Streptomyces sp. Je 1-79]MCT4352073.1 hypothetical protein [Streptomyces sp. Je 1-79]
MAAMAAAPAHAGLLDGSLNNLDLLDHISVLDSNINSDPETVENRNANTRADGLLGNAVGLLR